MRIRFMRLVVFFDLPVLTVEERRAYARFRKFLVKEGFIMMQESVYSKLVINNNASDLVKNHLVKNKPKKGLVQVLTVTEKQFASMEYIVGENNNNTLDSISRLVII